MGTSRSLGRRPAIVVTGASSGIGREIARVAGREGSLMLLVGRSKAALQAVADELAGSGRCGAALAIDLGMPESARAVSDALDRHGAYCDVLVNSAGFGLYGPAAALSPGDQLNLVDVNARALTELSLHFLPGMAERGRGGILNVGSMTGLVPGPNMAVYYASKAYVRSFSRALAAEMAGRGVTVTCLTAGVVKTAFFDRCPVGTTRISKLYPRMEAKDVAEIGWRAFRAGRREVIPGAANRAIALAVSCVPEAWTMRLVRALQS